MTIRSVDLKVLVIGGGGREHALAWKLAQSPRVQRVYVAPGNARHRARAALRKRRRSPTSPSSPTSRANEKIALTVVGPEAPLAAGVVDAFRAARPAHLRPDAGRGAARELEGLRQGVHAAPRHSDRALRDVHRRRGGARVRRRSAARRSSIKADGLAAGKGVVVAMTRGRGARRDRRDARRQRAWAHARRARGDRGVPRRRGGELHRHGATARTCCRSPRSRTTSACSDGDAGPEYRRHGRVLAGAGRHARRARARHARDHPARRRRHGRRRHRRTPASCTPGVMIDDARAVRRCSSSTAAWATRRRSRS